jgi:hypothetical protein
MLEELDAFHQVLYMLYHHHLPDGNVEQITASTKALKERMGILSGASLPDRLKRKEAEFNSARSKLAESVERLDPSLATTDSQAFTSQVEAMHSDYQALEAIFD